MNIAAVFIAYFGIKETQFHLDTGAWRGQYIGILFIGSKAMSHFLPIAWSLHGIF